ncbi:psbP domain-containing protein [Salix suchowensis]|nr:psbP domain-containing protein [Salix suchowensis]
MALQHYFLACKNISIHKIYGKSVFRVVPRVPATFFLLGSSLPQSGRSLKLDVFYPIGGYNRWIETNEGFENEPVVAFGPPGSRLHLFLVGSFMLLISKLSNFMIEAFGGPKEEGEAVVRTITGSHPDMKGTLTESSLREDSARQVNHYKLESPTFQQHNVAACCARDGLDYTP